MGTMSPCKALWALLALTCLCGASPSVPVATDPIVETTTISTVIPSVVTIYSVVPASDDPNALTTITTTINGQETTLTATASVAAGSVTNTIISTISVTTSEVVTSTVGYSTIFGPDPTESTPSTSSTESTTTTPAALPIPASTTSDATSTTSTGAVIAPTAGSASSGHEQTSSTSSAATSAASSSSAVNGSKSSSSKGLSTGAQAGIGVGVALGVLLLVLLSFFLGQRYSRRRNENAKHAYSDQQAAAAEEKDIFQAGRPYEDTGPQSHTAELPARKSNRYSRTTTEGGSGSESMSGKSYELPGSGAHGSHNHNGISELSALPQVNDDNPMYVGVPSHMSGTKRWSMKEYER